MECNVEDYITGCQISQCHASPYGADKLYFITSIAGTTVFLASNTLEHSEISVEEIYVTFMKDLCQLVGIFFHFPLPK